MQNYFIFPTETGWALQKQGATRPSKRAATKDEIQRLTSAFMQGKVASVKVQKEDGTIQEERTYPRRDDPRSSRG